MKNKEQFTYNLSPAMVMAINELVKTGILSRAEARAYLQVGTEKWS